MKRHEIAKLLNKSQRKAFGEEIESACHEVNQLDFTTKRQYSVSMKKANNRVDKKFKAIALSNQ